MRSTHGDAVAGITNGRQEVDFGIGPRVNKRTEFHFHSILDDEIWALLPSDYNVSSRSAITLAELALMPTLMLTKSAALRADLGRALAEQHVTLDSKYEGVQVQTMIAMVAAGLGAAILPRVAIPARDSSRFHALPVDPPMSRDICIITLAGQQLSPAAAQFANILERTLSRPGATVHGARQRTRRAQAG